MILYAGGDRVVVTHDLAAQGMVYADLIENRIFAAGIDLVKIGVTLANHGFPN